MLGEAGLRRRFGGEIAAAGADVMQDSRRGAHQRHKTYDRDDVEDLHLEQDTKRGWVRASYSLRRIPLLGERQNVKVYAKAVRTWYVAPQMRISA